MCIGDFALSIMILLPPQHGHFDDEIAKDVKGKPDGALGRFVRNLSKYGSQPAKDSAHQEDKGSAEGWYVISVHSVTIMESLPSGERKRVKQGH